MIWFLQGLCVWFAILGVATTVVVLWSLLHINRREHD